MEFSREIIINMLLNVAGYVTAGALWLVLWSAFSSRRNTHAELVQAGPGNVSDERPATAKTQEKRTEFISLKTDATAQDIELEERDRLRAEATRYQRNRAEVIRIAREMLRSGTSKDKVRSLLPISEGELALLANE